MPGFGGPTGTASLPATAGSTVYTYGNSELRGGVTKLSPKEGKVVSTDGNGWSRTVYTVTPGIPGTGMPPCTHDRLYCCRNAGKIHR